MKPLIPFFLTLVLTACGGGGGSSVNKHPFLNAVATVGNSNLIYNTAVGDLNGDGLDDVVVSGWNYDRDGASVFVYIQNADGTLSDRTGQVLPSNTIHGSQHIYIADFDNDGHNDIFIPGFLDGSAMHSATSVMFWGNTGQFIRQDFTEPVTAHGSCLDDINLDGYLDMVVAGGGVYYNNQNRTFTLDPTSLQGNLGFDSCAVIHQNNGDINIALGDNGPALGSHSNVYVYNSAMIFQYSFSIPANAGTDLVEINVLDTNQDGVKDFVLSFNYNDAQHSVVTSPYKAVYLNTAPNTYLLQSTLDTDNNEYHSYTIDLNGIPSIFFPGYKTPNRVYQVVNHALTEYRPGSFGSMSGGFGRATGGAVYQNASSGKVYMLYLLDGTYYTKEMI